ncbi:MAG: hypothetical protein MUF10_15225, partial [Thermoanaerobaculaceae bacterium]|nr:hypothetical protein [Thermoanaerobaculaceae bacterium]
MTKPREITESFRLDRVLKSSRSGIVFRATELGSGRGAAIKLIAPSCPADLHICQEQFLEAMEAWQDLKPAAFPELFDFGFTPDGSAFMVMEYAEGLALESLAGQDPRRLLRLLGAAASGLASLAERGVFHGNLTPQNLLARPIESGETALVLGFGTAAFRVFMGELTGAVLASDALEYAAPELVDPHAGLPRANARSDMYSLAQVACRVLQARVVTTPDGHVRLDLPPAVTTPLGGAVGLQEVLVQALQPRAEGRAASWHELLAVLDGVLAAEGGQPLATGGTLFLHLGEAPVPAATAPGEVPVEADGSTPPRDLTQPMMAVIDDEEGVPADDGAAAGGELPPPPTEPVAAPGRGPDEVFPPPQPPVEEPPRPTPGYETERTMAVPVHRLAELPAPGEEPSTETAPTQDVPPTSSVETTQPVAPATFVPSLPPSQLVFESSPQRSPAEALYDTDKGRVPVEPQLPPPIPVVPTQTPEPPSLPPAAVETAAAQLQEAVLEPPAATPPPLPQASPVTGRVPVAAVVPRKRGRTLWPLFVVLAVLLLGGGGVAFLWWQSQQAEQQARRRFVPPTPRPPTPAPTEAPKQPPAVLAQIRAFEEALAAGDLKAAQQALETITPADEQQLPPADLDHLQGLRTSYAELRVRTLGNDLTRAVEAGNLRAMQRILGSITREEQTALASNPDKAQTIEEARRALNILKLAQTAERSGAWGDLLQQATALRELMPKADAAAEWREKAAKGLEAEAATAAQAGNYQQALDRLGALAKAWPDRPGLRARIDRVEADREADQKVTAVLAQAEQSERQQRPESGLAMLQALRPPARLEGKVAELRQRLQALLKQLDAQPPKVELQRGVKLEFDKGKLARIPLVVSDDHGVKSAKLFARVEGSGKFVEMNLTHGTGTEYAAEFTA